MANDLNLGDLKITLETFEDSPVKATFDLPDGSTVARNFPHHGELVMRLGLGLGLNHRVLNAPPALAISGTPVLTATEDEAYSGFTVSATGGTEPYAFSIASGALPAGITLNSSTGAVSGAPTESGSFADIVIRVTDAALATDNLAPFTLEVEAALLSVLWQTSAQIAGTQTVYSFAAQAIGSAAADRYVIVGTWGGPNTRTVVGLTVGGVAASLLKRTQAGSVTSELWIAAVPNGTTADVEVTWSGAQTGCAISIWSARDLASAVPVDTDGGNITSTASFTLDSTPGGFAVGMGVHSNVTSGTIEWTGVSERFETLFSGAARYSGADGVTASTSVVVTCRVAATANPNCPVAIATLG